MSNKLQIDEGDELERNQHVKLWSIQSERAFIELQTVGCLTAVEPFVDPDLADAYSWIGNEMRQRGLESNEASSPIWAWERWDGSERKRQDLRSSWHGIRGTPLVLLELSLPFDRILLSDFELWHYVLNLNFLAHSFESEARFNAESIPPPVGSISDWSLVHQQTLRRMKKSWQQIFDLRLLNEFYSVSFSLRSVQATFWELHAADILSVKRFVSR